MIAHPSPHAEERGLFLIVDNYILKPCSLSISSIVSFSGSESIAINKQGLKSTRSVLIRLGSTFSGLWAGCVLSQRKEGTT
jgi:hypothetical protein